MKNTLTLLFCLCIIFSSFGLAGSTKQQTAKNELNFVSSKTVAVKEIPNIFRPVGNWFKRLFVRRKGNVDPNDRPIINNVTFSQGEIMAICLMPKSSGDKSCSDLTQSIEISTEAIDPENDTLLYVYKISGGKIIGEGAKVIWNLSGVKPGIYTIIVGADDGGGLYDNVVKKEIKVVECPNCN
jgi:hypothetical protein